MKKHPYLPYFLVVISGLSTDIYMPSMPAMTKVFQVAMSDIQYSITFFVLGLGVAQLIAGPISDALGRRSLMLVSLAMQIISTLALVFAPHIYVLWVARFIQGFAIAFLSVPARAILNDCYSGDELKKKFITMTTTFGLAPIIAPFIGGLAEYYYGWQLSFVILLVYLFVCFMYVFFFYQETLLDKQTFHLIKSFKNYLILLASRPFMLTTLLLCFISTYNYIVITLGPFLFQQRFHLNALVYGDIALFIGFGWFLGNLCSRILFHINMYHRCYILLATQGLLGSILLTFAYFNAVTVTKLVIIFFLYSLSASFLFGMLVGEALASFPKLAASANGFLFSCLWLFFGLSSLIASYLPIKNLMPLSYVFLVNFVCSLLLVIASLRVHKECL